MNSWCILNDSKIRELLYRKSRMNNHEACQILPPLLCDSVHLHSVMSLRSNLYIPAVLLSWIPSLTPPYCDLSSEVMALDNACVIGPGNSIHFNIAVQANSFTFRLLLIQGQKVSQLMFYIIWVNLVPTLPLLCSEIILLKTCFSWTSKPYCPKTAPQDVFPRHPPHPPHHTE
jgi:hypothetical protein